jgi:hypothetical protein
MKQYITFWGFLLFSLGFINSGFSQDSSKHQSRQSISPKVSKESTISFKSCNGIQNSNSKPLYIINNYLLPTNAHKTFNFLNTNNIDNITVLNKNDSLTNLYGEKAENGVIIVQFKTTTQLLTLTETLNYFGVAYCDQNLKTCINRELCISTNTFRFDLSANFKVEIVDDYYFIDGIITQNNERFINFITSSN